MLPPIEELWPKIKQGEISPVEITEECLSRIERLNSQLNAFITVTADLARESAKRAEREIREGKWRGPLHGIPLGLKDLIDTAGVRTTAASRQYENRTPDADAPVVEKLKSAGGVVLGKQNLHEFAYGGSNLISVYGIPRNPWNVERITGGSSGGSAASVAAELCCAGIGTDTAGSVRLPAALCGIVGFKPTYGRISTRGIIPLSPSLDHVGPITRTVADAALLFYAMDASPSPSSNPDPFNLKSAKVPPLRIGVPRKFFFDDTDPEILAATEDALDFFRRKGHALQEVEVTVPEDRVLQNGEAFAVHAGMVEQSPDLYQPETLRRIRNGESTTAAEVNEQRERLKLLRSEISDVFANVDLLVTPCTPRVAPSIAELQYDPEVLRPREILLLRNTRPFNVWGLPAISLPCGFASSGLPIGLQIAGAHNNDALVLQLAESYERETDWHNKVADITV